MNLNRYAVNYWLNEKDDYFDYWNNESFEKGKEWYVLDGNFDKLEKFLEETGLLKELLKYSDYMKGTGIDLAAGNLWAAPHILKYAEKLYCRIIIIKNAEKSLFSVKDFTESGFEVELKFCATFIERCYIFRSTFFGSVVA